MSEQKENRKIRLQIRITEKENKKLHASFALSACRKYSEFLRSAIFQKPVIAFTRDRSKDECILELIQLKKELNAIGNNFNQLVKRLHTIDHSHTAFPYLTAQANLQKAVLTKITEIKDYMNQLVQQWSQE